MEADPNRPTRRIDYGALATALTVLSTVLVAVTSVFTAVQAMQISKASAQQKLFEEQLSVCLSLNELVAEVAATNDAVVVTLTDLGPTLDAAEASTVKTTLDAGVEQYTRLNREYLKLSMLLPRGNVQDTMHAAMDAHFDQHNAAWERMEARRASPDDVRRLEAMMTKEGDLLTKTQTACTRYVAGVVNGERIAN